MILSCFLPTCLLRRKNPLSAACIQNLFMLGPWWRYQHVGRLLFDVYVVEFVLIQSCKKNVFLKNIFMQKLEKREHNRSNSTAVCRGKRKRREREGNLSGQTASRYSNLKYAHSYM